MLADMIPTSRLGKSSYNRQWLGDPPNKSQAPYSAGLLSVQLRRWTDELWRRWNLPAAPDSLNASVV